MSAIAPDGTFYLFDTQSKVLSLPQRPGLTYALPEGVAFCINAQGHLLLATQTHVKTFLIEVVPLVASKFKIIHTELSSRAAGKDVCGICSDWTTGNTFVADCTHESGEYNQNIYRITPDGKKQTFVTRIINLAGMCPDRQGNLIIFDSRGIRKIYPNKTGTVIFSDPQIRPYEMKLQNDICVDYHGGVLLLDKNNRDIKLIDPVKKHMTVIYTMKPQEKLPEGLTMDCKGNVYYCLRWNVEEWEERGNRIHMLSTGESTTYDI